MSERVVQLRQENAQLKHRIGVLEGQQQRGELKGQIARFVEESKKNIAEMNRKIGEENSRQNEILHKMTASYEGVLKRQIELLNENKQLSQQKESQDKTFNQDIEKLTLHYEGQIKAFQNKVKANVRRIQELANGGNMVGRLLGNPRFRQAMQARGCSLEALEKQSRLEEISSEVEEKEKEIQEAQERSSRLDEELTKMHELIDTMKSLLENMMKEKDNIIKQNAVLKEKLKQSEELIGRLLGADIPQEEEGEDVQEEEQGEEGQ